MKRRVCETCAYFQSADFDRNGWCQHPKRAASTGVQIMVRASELACRDGWRSDMWVPKGSQLDGDSDLTTADATPNPGGDDRLTSIQPFRVEKIANSSKGEGEDLVVDVTASAPKPVSPEKSASDLVQNPKEAIKRAREQFRSRRVQNGRLADAHVGTPILAEPAIDLAEDVQISQTTPAWKPLNDVQASQTPDFVVPPVTKEEFTRPFPELTSFSEDTARFESLPDLQSTFEPASRSLQRQDRPDHHRQAMQISDDLEGELHAEPASALPSHDAQMPAPTIESDDHAVRHFVDGYEDEADANWDVPSVSAAPRRRVSFVNRWWMNRRTKHQVSREDSSYLDADEVLEDFEYLAYEDEQLLAEEVLFDSPPVVEHQTGPDLKRSQDTRERIPAAHLPQSDHHDQSVGFSRSTRSVERHTGPNPPTSPPPAGRRRRSDQPSDPALDPEFEHLMSPQDNDVRHPPIVASNTRDTNGTSYAMLDEDLPVWDHPGPPLPKMRADSIDEVNSKSVAPDLPRICRTCRDFRPAGTGERGWCDNKEAFGHRRMVDADELACGSSSWNWWLPHDGIWQKDFDTSRYPEPTPRVDRLLAATHRYGKGESIEPAM